MKKSQKSTLLKAMRTIRAAADLAEELVDKIPVQDIGPTVLGREEMQATVKHIASMLELLQMVHGSLENHVGAVNVIDRTKFPRAKTISESRKS